jgi:hypothetical protein
MERDTRSQKLLFISPGVSSKERYPDKTNLTCLSKSSVKEPPIQGSPAGYI